MTLWKERNWKKTGNKDNHNQGIKQMSGVYDALERLRQTAEAQANDLCGAANDVEGWPRRFIEGIKDELNKESGESLTDEEIEERTNRICSEMGVPNFQEKLLRCGAAAMNLQKRAEEALKALPEAMRGTDAKKSLKGS